jgi:hypothetical protein
MCQEEESAIGQQAPTGPEEDAAMEALGYGV